MTKIIKYFCNKCNKEINGQPFCLSIHPVIPSFLDLPQCYGVSDSVVRGKEYNLCHDCAEKIKEYLNYERKT